jgi:ribokinase
MIREKRADRLTTLHSKTFQTIIVTLGAEWVIAIHDGQIHRAKGLNIKPVDTADAGGTSVDIWRHPSTLASSFR